MLLVIGLLRKGWELVRVFTWMSRRVDRSEDIFNQYLFSR